MTFQVQHIRRAFADLLTSQSFVSVNREASMTGIVGNKTIEIIGASFVADEDSIFGAVNWDYVKREEEWYNSMSLNVNDIPGGTPVIWKKCADKEGFINSNYGWAIYSDENGRQFENVVKELRANPESRRAEMIYNRPSMWTDYNKNGRSDFMCTNAVQYVIRNGVVNAIVQMRSNDVVYGYKNDRAWQKHVLDSVSVELGFPSGNLLWNVGSLHVYAKDFYLVDHFAKTGEKLILKETYKNLYPESQYK